MSTDTVNQENDENWVAKVEMTEVLFFRHAESFNNVLYDFIRSKYGKDSSSRFIEEQEKSLRQIDSSLSEKGFKQLELLKSFAESGALAKAVNASTPDMSDWIIISSPMERCLLTSQALAQGLGNRTVYVHPHIYESGGCHGVNPGSPSKEIIGFPGTTKAEVEAKFSLHKCLPGMEQGWYYSKPREENFQEFQFRVREIVKWLWSIHNTPEENRRNLLGLEVPKFKNIIIVNHGNTLNGIISGLQTGSGLVTHNNTGYSHVQLTTGRHHRQYTVVKFLNKSDHLLTFQGTNTSIVNVGIGVDDNSQETHNDEVINPDLVTGNNTIKDGWLAEFQPSY